MSTASLVVRILADLDGFSRGMSKAEREMVKTAGNMQSLGQKLSLGVTLPFVALGTALAKSAADDEASVKKLERAFGTSAGNMERFITDLMKTVPATDDALRGLTVSTDTLLRSMGLGVPKATAMTQAVTKLAGDLAAFNHVGIDVAQGTLEKALAGQTKGLKEFGVVISEADIKARAYALGLAKQGAELTHATTAQAAWSLILEKTKAQQGEAARTIGDSANAMARLSQAADNAGDAFGAVFLPTAAKVVGAISRILQGLADLPSGTKAVIVGIGGIAAVAGPAIFVLGGLTEKFLLLRRALTTISGTTALGGLIKIALNPWALAAAAGVAVLGAALFKAGENARKAREQLDQYRDGLVKIAAMPETAAKPLLTTKLLAEQAELQRLQRERAALVTQKTNLPVSQASFLFGSPQSHALEDKIAKIDRQIAAVKPRFDAVVQSLVDMGNANLRTNDTLAPTSASLKDIETNAQAVLTAFELMKNGLAPIPGFAGALFAALADVDRAAAKIPNRFDPLRLKLEQIGQTIRREIIEPLEGLTTLQLPGARITPGNTRPTFTPGPGQVQIGGMTAPSPTIAALPQIPAQLSTIQQAMRAGFLQVSVAIGDTLATRLATMFGGRGIGAQIGGTLGGAFGGGVGTVLGGAAAASIGGLLGAGVGSVIPVVGTLIGGVLGSAIGGLFGGHRKSVDNSASSLDRLAKTVDKVTASITNLPEFFKVQAYRYQAAPVGSTSPLAPPITGVGPLPSPGGPTPKPKSPSDPGTGGPDSLRPTGKGSFDFRGSSFVLPGVQNAKDFYDALTDESLRRVGTGAPNRFAFASSGLR